MELLMEDYKTQGDNFYNNKEYLYAINMYSLGLSCKEENKSQLLKLYLNRNLSYMKLNRYEDAMNDAQSAIKLDCNNAKAWGRLGSALCALGRFKKANEAFKLSHKLEPNELLIHSDSITNLLEMVNLNFMIYLDAYLIDQKALAKQRTNKLKNILLMWNQLEGQCGLQRQTIFQWLRIQNPIDKSPNNMPAANKSV